jgi:hypothetical protein
MTDLNQALGRIAQSVEPHFRNDFKISIEEASLESEVMRDILLAADVLWDAIPSIDDKFINIAKLSIENAIIILVAYFTLYEKGEDKAAVLKDFTRMLKIKEELLLNEIKK